MMKNERKTVVLVDDNITNLNTGKAILKEKYKVFPVQSGPDLFELLEKVSPDLILLDIEMPGMDGYTAIRKLKADDDLKSIPVIFLTALSDPGSELEGLDLGAVDYISKPFSAPLLLKRLENHLTMAEQRKTLESYNELLVETVVKRTGQVDELQNAILNTVAELVEARDSVTGGHINRTQQYLTLLVDKILDEGLYRDATSKWNMEYLIPSAQLHDVGKIAISDTILNKPGRLTPEEFAIMKKHVDYGEAAIDAIMKNTRKKEFLGHARVFAATHHEKWDGSGYPRGLKGDDIPLEGRLMAIADVYDALIAKRPYKEPLSAAETEDIILKSRETHFDPVLVDLFKDLKFQFADIASAYNQQLKAA
ncbi:MAG: response regulator [Synergistaceae bacterium]|jgi:putative two-component system response regulator|nr:response regulator [Synergistaceae bacterium]